MGIENMGKKNHTQLLQGASGGASGAQGTQNDSNHQLEKFPNKTMMEPAGGLHKRNVQQVDGIGAVKDVRSLVDNQ